MNAKKLYWISGAILIIFIISLLILRISDKIKLSTFLIIGIISIVLVIITDAIMYFRKSTTQNILQINTEKELTPEELDKISEQLLLDPKYAEYESEIIWRDTLSMGNSNTPIYFKLISGLYTGNYFGIVINVKNPNRGGIQEYQKGVQSVEVIKLDMMKRGNLAALLPSPDISFRTRESYDPLTGRTILEKEPLGIKEEKNKEGELK